MFTLLITFLCLLLSFNTYAMELPYSFQVNGFVSQGFSKTSANKFFGESSDANGSFEFREAGLAVSKKWTPSINMRGTLIHRVAGNEIDTLEIDTLEVSWNAVNSKFGSLVLHAGKLRLPYGFYGDTRDVPFTRPSVVLPQSIYFERTRNLALAGYGVAAMWSWAHKNHSLDANLAIGYPKVSNRAVDMSLLGESVRGSVISGGIGAIGRLAYNNWDYGLTMSVTQAYLPLAYEDAEKDLLQNGSLLFVPTVISLQWRRGMFIITTEYAHRVIEFNDFGEFLPDMKVSGRSYYGQIEYRVTDKLKLLARYDSYVADKTDPDGKQYAALTGKHDYSRFSKDFTLGVSYDITKDLNLSVDYHRIEGTGTIPQIDNIMAKSEKDWNLLIAQLSWRF